MLHKSGARVKGTVAKKHMSPGQAEDMRREQRELQQIHQTSRGAIGTGSVSPERVDSTFAGS